MGKSLRGNKPLKRNNNLANGLLLTSFVITTNTFNKRCLGLIPSPNLIQNKQI